MSDDRDAAERRRAARRAWPIVCFSLGEEPPDDLAQVTTPAARIAMMWPLALEAWSVAGRAMPTYDRRNLPTRLFRAWTRPPEE